MSRINYLIMSKYDIVILKSYKSFNYCLVSVVMYIIIFKFVVKIMIIIQIRFQNNYNAFPPYLTGFIFLKVFLGGKVSAVQLFLRNFALSKNKTLAE